MVIAMTLLRFLLILGLIYYGIKLLARWIFRPNFQRSSMRKEERTAHEDQNYKELTDQEIDDADFEDIEQGGE